MGQLAIITALGAMLLASIVLFTARGHTGDAQDAGAAYTVERLAREAALVGLEEALTPLNRDVDDWPTVLADAQAAYNIATTTYGTGSYTVTVDNMVHGATPTDPDRVWLTATGVHEGWSTLTQSNQPTEVVIQAVYETAKTDIGTPPGMRDAVQTNDDLLIRGNGCVSGGTHSNGDTSTSGNTFDVLGTSTYTGSESANDSRFTGGVLSSDSVYIPLAQFPPNPVVYTHSGNLALPSGQANPSPNLAAGWFGITGYGTGTQAYVLHVQGDLTFSGNVVLPGFSQIWVDGEVTISGNSVVSPVTAPPPVVSASWDCATKMAAIEAWKNTNLVNGQSMMAIYADGNITMGGNTKVVAHLWTNQAFSYTGGGNPERLIIGGITAQNNLELKGNTMIYYTEAAEVVTNPGGNEVGHEGLRLVGYNEFADRP